MFIGGKTIKKTKRMIITKVRTAVRARGFNWGVHRGLHGPSLYSFTWGMGIQTFTLLFWGERGVRVSKVFCKCDIFCNKHMGKGKKKRWNATQLLKSEADTGPFMERSLRYINK